LVVMSVKDLLKESKSFLPNINLVIRGVIEIRSDYGISRWITIIIKLLSFKYARVKLMQSLLEETCLIM
jgi:hypothetical protein